MNIKCLFNKDNRAVTIFACICFVLGLMFCISPSLMMDAFETIMCFLFLAYGGIMMFAYCIAPVVFANKKIMISSIVSIVLGSLLLFVRSFFMLALALCILTFAVFKFLVLKKAGKERNLIFYLWLILGVLYTIVSLLVIVFFAINKFNSISLILVGVCLTLEAVANIFSMIHNYNINKPLANKPIETEIEE